MPTSTDQVSQKTDKIVGRPHKLPTERRRGDVTGVDTAAIESVYKLIKEKNVEIIDLRFADIFGLWQHYSIPAKELMDYSSLEHSIWVDGIGFDGSSIRGFQAIEESDMILLPDPETAFVDPVLNISTLVLMCDIFDPNTHMPYTRDARFIAKKAEAYLASTGIADISYWGPEAEFFIFDHVQYSQGAHHSSYMIDSEEGAWNSGNDDVQNLGYTIRHKEGYFPVPPHDTLQDLRSEIILDLAKCGIQVEVHHHEVATAGQCEIDMRFKSLTKMADQLFIYKYIIKNVARKHGKVATFMPKPIFGDNGSGMHTHQSLWKDKTNLFFDSKGYAMLSDMARWYIGGLLKHAHALMAFCAPTTNSYKRLVPGYEAPVNLVYSQRNRSAACRIPTYSENPKARRIEFRSPDPTCNSYLAFPAMLMAGLDGVMNKIEPGDPMEANTFEMTGSKARKMKTMPGSLAEALSALEKDREFLIQGGVFTDDLIDTYLKEKWSEVDYIRLRPHPAEFEMYFDK